MAPASAWRHQAKSSGAKASLAKASLEEGLQQLVLVGGSLLLALAAARADVPELVFALIFVLAFGLGPIAGVLAIVIHTTGALGKLFYEVRENIDQKPVEGLIASGA